MEGGREGGTEGGRDGERERWRKRYTCTAAHQHLMNLMATLP